MTPYYVVLFALASLAIAESAQKRPQKYLGRSAALIIAAFAGLRFETGFDWMGYDAYFRASPTIIEYLSGVRDPHTYNMETGFFLLNVLLKSFVDDVHFLLFVTSAATVAGTHYVISRITQRTAIVWLAYFGVLFIAGQMTLVRQNIASTIVLVSLLLAVNGRALASASGILASAFFQISAIVFLPLPAAIRWHPPAIFAAISLLAGLSFALMGVRLFESILLAMSGLLPKILEVYAIKIAYYSSASLGAITPTYIAMAAAHLGMLSYLYLRANDSEKRDPIIRMAIWLLIGLKLAQFTFFSATDLWARIMLVTTPWAIAACFRISATNELPSLVRLTGAATVALAAALVLTRQLTATPTSPLIPYHSLVQVALGDKGDGRERAIQAWVRDYPVQEHIDVALEEYRRLGVYEGYVERRR